MHFALLDRVLERTDDAIVTIKAVSRSEEYLLDHFPSFPVLPGVFMLEAMVQAARELTGETSVPVVLGSVRSLKYGRFVQPGDTMRIEVQRAGKEPGALDFKGTVRVLSPEGGETPIAASGRFMLRPVRLGGVPEGAASAHSGVAG